MRKKRRRIVRFNKVKSSNGWLSGMSAHPLVHNGLLFRTVEALFQWLRFEGHSEVQSQLQNCLSPQGVKMIARRNKDLLDRTENWDYAEDDRERMKFCLKLKLEIHYNLKKKLLATGNAVIFEDCTKRNREAAKNWGKVKVGEKWVGDNVFGKLWMELRSEL